MTKNETPVSIDICTDCVFLLANGGCEGCLTCAFSDHPEDEDCQTVADRMEKEWPGVHITLGSTDCEHCPDEEGTDCEAWFSWSSCEGCGSHLGGNRHHATAWVAT